MHLHYNDRDRQVNQVHNNTQCSKKKKMGAIKKYGEAEFLPQHIRTILAVNYLEPTFCGFPQYTILVSFHTPCIMSKISSVLVFYSIFNNLK